MAEFNEDVVINGDLTLNGVVDSGNPNTTPLVVHGAVGQAEALQRWETNGDDVLAQVTADGRILVGDALGTATDDALIEAYRDAGSTKPKRGLNTLGRISTVLNDVVQWVFTGLELSGGVTNTGVQSNLRSEVTHDNSGGSSQELRAGEFEVVNQAGTVTKAVGVRVAVSNEAGSTLTNAIGLEVELGDEGTLSNAYAIKVNDIDQGQSPNNFAFHTGKGTVHLGDKVELAIPASLPGVGDHPSSGVWMYPKPDGKLYVRDAAEQEYDLTQPPLVEHNHETAGGDLTVNAIPTLPASKLANYPDNTTTFLRGDGQWVAPTLGSHTHDTADIVSGTIADARLPIGTSIQAHSTNLDSWAAILPSAKADVAHTHNAVDINAGTLHIDRIPVIPASKLENYPADGTKFLAGDGIWKAVAGSQWADVAGGINYPGGNVGIGAPPTVGKLDVRQSTAATHVANFYAESDDYGITVGRRSAPAAGIAINIGASLAGSYGIIQAYNYAVGPVNLLLQKDGGNVGIGTGSAPPTAKLEIAVGAGQAGTDNLLRFNLTGGDPYSYFLTLQRVSVDGGGFPWMDYRFEHKSWNTSVGHVTKYPLTFYRNGYVGINNTSPSAQLSIWTDSNAGAADRTVALLLDRLYHQVGDCQDIVFGGGNGDAANRTAIIRAIANAGGEASLAFLTQTGSGDAANHESMRILGNGNVGIGVLSPLARHHVKASGASDGPVLGSANGGTLYLEANGGPYGLQTGISNAGHVWFQVQRHDGNTSTYPLVFNPGGGNVGIGTSPGYKLHVAGDGRFDAANGRIYIGVPASAGAPGLEFIQESSQVYSIRHHDPGVAWRDLALCPYGGNVGIGLNDPSYKLQVHGSVYLQDGVRFGINDPGGTASRVTLTGIYAGTSLGAYAGYIKVYIGATAYKLPYYN